MVPLPSPTKLLSSAPHVLPCQRRSACRRWLLQALLTGREHVDQHPAGQPWPCALHCTADSQKHTACQLGHSNIASMPGGTPQLLQRHQHTHPTLYRVKQVQPWAVPSCSNLMQAEDPTACCRRRASCAASSLSSTPCITAASALLVRGLGSTRCTRTLAPCQLPPFLNPHARHSGRRGQPEHSSLSLTHTHSLCIIPASAAPP
jgi:hypothetical protein